MGLLKFLAEGSEILKDKKSLVENAQRHAQLEVGQTYTNKNGSDYKVLSGSGDTWIMRQPKSGWTFTAHVITMYDDGQIEWDYSTDGTFDKVDESKLADRVRKNDLDYDEETDSVFAKDDDKDIMVQFQDRENDTYFISGKDGKPSGEKHPRVSSQTWGRVWNKGDVKHFNGPKYVVRKDVAKYLDDIEEESLNEDSLEEAGQRLNLAKYFTRSPEDDFTDDGNRFTCYRYGPNGEFRISKLVYNGDAYISARWHSKKNRNYKSFDDLNGVPVETAVRDLPKLKQEMDDFLANLDEYDHNVELSDQDIEKIVTAHVQNGKKWLSDTLIKELGYDYSRLTNDQVHEITDRIKNNTPVDNDRLKEDVTAMVKDVMKEMSPGYDSRGRFVGSKNLTNAIATCSWRIKDYPQATQQKVINRIQKNIQELLDFNTDECLTEAIDNDDVEKVVDAVLDDLKDDGLVESHDPRKFRNKLYDLIDNGQLSYRRICLMLMNYLSDNELGDFMVRAAIIDEDEEEELNESNDPNKFRNKLRQLVKDKKISLKQLGDELLDGSWVDDDDIGDMLEIAFGHLLNDNDWNKLNEAFDDVDEFNIDVYDALCDAAFKHRNELKDIDEEQQKEYFAHAFDKFLRMFFDEHAGLSDEEWDELNEAVLKKIDWENDNEASRKYLKSVMQTMSSPDIRFLFGKLVNMLPYELIDEFVEEQLGVNRDNPPNRYVVEAKKNTSDVEGTIGKVLQKHKDEFSKVQNKKDVLDLLDKYEGEIEDKKYLEKVKMDMQRKNDFAAIKYVYDIFLAGDDNKVR